jgi:uncharacterized protein YndB with AHSA1/START domain
MSKDERARSFEAQDKLKPAPTKPLPAKQQATRTIRKEIEIDAPVEAVWKALTNGEELARWFPLEARVKPGVGGTIFLSWGPDCEGEGPISAWEEGRRYAWTEGAVGDPTAPVVEWTIEARGGKTLVRIVNSGFTTGSDAENEKFDSMDYGWLFMLVNLRHYLERHAGAPRLVAWPRKKIAIPREQAYDRITGPQGMFTEGDPAHLGSGADYSARTAWGESYSGFVKFVVPSRGFCLSVKELNDALLWVTIEGAPGNLEAQVWLSAYAIPQARVDEFSKHGAELLNRLFA